MLALPATLAVGRVARSGPAAADVRACRKISAVDWSYICCTEDVGVSDLGFIGVGVVARLGETDLSMLRRGAYCTWLFEGILTRLAVRPLTCAGDSGGGGPLLRIRACMPLEVGVKHLASMLKFRPPCAPGGGVTALAWAPALASMLKFSPPCDPGGGVTDLAEEGLGVSGRVSRWRGLVGDTGLSMLTD